MKRKGVSKIYKLGWGGSRISIGKDLTDHVLESLGVDGKGDMLVTESNKAVGEIILRRLAI